MSKVYVRPDADGRIIAIDGGYSIGNIHDFSEWVQIDEGEGDRFNLCQCNYLQKPLMDERCVYRYKLVEGSVVERSQEEMDADYIEPTLPDAPTLEERVDILEATTDDMILLMAELIGG